MPMAQGMVGNEPQGPALRVRGPAGRWAVLPRHSGTVAAKGSLESELTEAVTSAGEQGCHRGTGVWVGGDECEKEV